jgi:hypothetical protein
VSSTRISNGSVSILAGCMQSPGWARLLLHSIIAEAHARWPAIGPQQHIDDLSQTCVAASEQAHSMEQDIVESALFIQKELRKKRHCLGLQECHHPEAKPESAQDRYEAKDRKDVHRHGKQWQGSRHRRLRR